MLLTNRLAGVVGLSISAALWCIALWRLVYHVVYCKEQQNEMNRLTPRRLFHALLW